MTSGIKIENDLFSLFFPTELIIMSTLNLQLLYYTDILLIVEDYVHIYL